MTTPKKINIFRNLYFFQDYFEPTNTDTSYTIKEYTLNMDYVNVSIEIDIDKETRTKLGIELHTFPTKDSTINIYSELYGKIINVETINFTGYIDENPFIVQGLHSRILENTSLLNNLNKIINKFKELVPESFKLPKPQHTDSNEE